jgi:DNA-binding NtrC family response regulator
VLQIERTRLLGSAHIIRKSSWNKSTPIIIVTGRADRQTMQDAVAVEASFFLQQPVDRQKLSVLFRTVSGGMLEDRRKYLLVQSRWTSPEP